jgi:hypothetical protein
MIVYSYSSYTLQYNGLTDAFESPLEPGVFHHPAHTTTIAPPDFNSATQTCKFVSGDWVVEEIPAKPIPETPTPAEVEESAVLNGRAWRDTELDRADIQINIIEDSSMMVGAATVWRAYRVLLRNWPATPDFPEIKPVAPDGV